MHHDAQLVLGNIDRATMHMFHCSDHSKLSILEHKGLGESVPILECTVTRENVLIVTLQI